jgi:hypothetical protein
VERQKQPGEVGSPKDDIGEILKTRGTGITGDEHPRGTLFLLLVYLIVVIAIWGTVYLTMLERG